MSVQYIIYTNLRFVYYLQIFAYSSVQSLSRVLTLCDPMDCSMPGFSVRHQLPELAQTHVHWVGDVIQPSPPLSSSSPSAFNLSQHHGIFKWVSSLHQGLWPKDWSFSLSINPSNEYSGLISFRMDWLDLPAVQETQESSPTPQFKSTNCSVFSFLYGPTHNHTWLLENHNFD